MGDIAEYYEQQQLMEEEIILLEEDEEFDVADELIDEEFIKDFGSDTQ